MTQRPPGTQQAFESKTPQTPACLHGGDPTPRWGMRYSLLILLSVGAALACSGPGQTEYEDKGVVCLRKDEIAAFALSEPSIVRDINTHDEWADWERRNGAQRITPIA